MTSQKIMTFGSKKMYDLTNAN